MAKSPARVQAKPLLHVLDLPPFVDVLPMPEIVAANSSKRIRIAMREIHASLHRDLPPTRLWSYGEQAVAPLLVGRQGEAAEIEWSNQLPSRHFLPIDYTLHGCGHDVPEVRACVHLHGGRVPSNDDGHPEDWYMTGQSRVCRYPMKQEAATLWYHDHAMGLNRLNIYAGLFGMFLVRDAAEETLRLPCDECELPLILYDRELTQDAQLHYPVSDDPERPWMPAFTGDAILVNGKIRPYADVEARAYRLRLLNAANSRFFLLSCPGAEMVQVGSDQGLLASPLPVQRLMLAPAERADIVMDFSEAAGRSVSLRNGALDILQFRVKRKGPVGSPAFRVPPQLRAIERMDETSAVRTRRITLHEYQDDYGRSMVMLLNRKHWHEPVTEVVKLGSTEIWEFVNQTDDTHPMHLHLVRFQVLDRRPFDGFAFMMHREMKFTGPAVPPEPNEMGWKDVVQCEPGVVTRILVKFDGYAGRYLYHCHILEHEANDMMRPFEVMG